MKKQAFFNRFSFFSLDGDEPSSVRAYVLQQDDRAPFDNNELFRTRLDRLAALDFYRPWLHEHNPVCFPWLDKAQRQVLEDELFFSFYLLCAQYQLEQTEARQHQLTDLKADILLSVDLINQLRLTPSNTEPTSPEIALRLLPRDPAHPTDYLGVTMVARQLAAQIKAPLFESLSRDYSYFHWIRQQMCFVNEKRLYWVWGGGFLRSIVELLPETFYYQGSAEWVLNQISPITGTMSFALYYARGFLELLLLLKHTIDWGEWTPWMNPEEQQMTLSWWERFQTQWALRKYNLLNDFIWATCNMSCYYWLIDDRIALGKMSYGYLGNVFTAVLLFMDASLSLLRYQEQYAQHEVTFERHQRALSVLDLQILCEADPQKKSLLEQQRKFLQQIMQHDALEWKYSDKQLRQDLTYALSLLLAFAFLCCFFVTPVGPGLQIILNVAGSGLCWALNVWNDAMLQQLKIDQAHEMMMLSQQKQQSVITQISNQTLTDSEQRLLYIEHLAAQAKAAQQQVLMHAHMTRLIYTTTIELIVPPLLFGVLVFLPFSEALLVLIGVVIIANYLHASLMHESDDPHPQKVPFDEEAFCEFKAMVTKKYDALSHHVDGPASSVPEVLKDYSSVSP